MREVIELYMKEHIEWFNTEIEFPLSANWEYSKYGVTFLQGSFQYANIARQAAELEETGVYITQYILPWEYEPVTKVSIEEPPPSYWYILSIVEDCSKKLHASRLKSVNFALHNTYG
ncbi:MAG: hypothetical protein DRJ38_03150 [Thermoprotei archaeon]|nr:MAG: hypothetical protein DRJ38_03150 [Thermoprotei archaeon]